MKTEMKQKGGRSSKKWEAKWRSYWVMGCVWVIWISTSVMICIILDETNLAVWSHPLLSATVHSLSRLLPALVWHCCPQLRGTSEGNRETTLKNKGYRKKWKVKNCVVVLGSCWSSDVADLAVIDTSYCRTCVTKCLVFKRCLSLQTKICSGLSKNLVS